MENVLCVYFCVQQAGSGWLRGVVFLCTFFSECPWAGKLSAVTGALVIAGMSRRNQKLKKKGIRLEGHGAVRQDCVRGGGALGNPRVAAHAAQGGDPGG